jgi:error-prone DNA polymerase
VLAIAEDALREGDPSLLWPNKFEIYRRQIMSASMIAMRGRLQKEGEVIHIICDRIIDHDAMLRSIGRMDFTVPPGRDDGAPHGGGPDPRDPTFPSGRPPRLPTIRHDGGTGRDRPHPQP